MELKRVKLKPNSPEFADDEDDRNEFGDAPVCDMPGCSAPAPHRAPKSRAAGDYYNFCLEHVQDYNRAWNFFEGMAPQDVEDHMKANFYGHRPTWNFTGSPDMEDHLRQRAQDFRDFGASSREKENEQAHQNQDDNQDGRSSRIMGQTAETEAMAIMGLEPPLDLDKIKARYKELAKKHHPDLNRDDPNSEETFKKINMSYTVLKLAYERYKDRFAD